MDSFYTEQMSVTSPQTPDERVLLMGSGAIGGVGAETESNNGSRFREFLDGDSLCAIDTHVGDGSKTWYENGTVKAVRNDFICCHKSLLPSVESCRILDRAELTESKRVDHRALAVSFHSSTFHFHTTKKTRIHTRAPPKVSRVLCGDAWRQEAFQQRLSCSIPKHIQIDEAYAGMVAKITEAATPRETFRAPACRPSKWWIGAHAWSALQRQRLSQRKFRQEAVATRSLCDVSLCNPPCGGSFKRTRSRRQLLVSTCHSVVEGLMRASHESKALVTVDREAHFRSLFDQAKAAEYQGNV